MSTQPQQPGTSPPARDLTGYGRALPDAGWPDEAQLALCFVVNYEEGAEYGPGDETGRIETHGTTYAFPPGVRNLRLESDYEYGSRVGIWRLFDLFAQEQIPITMHASAVAVELNPDVGQACRELDFEVCAHGWRWEEQWTLTAAEELDRIRRAAASLERTCGTRPSGWYSRYGPSPHTRAMVVEAGGFLYDSDAYNDDLPYFVDVEGAQHLVVPYSGVYNDTRLLHGALDDPDGLVRLMRHAVNQYLHEGKTRPRMMTVGLHPRIAGQAGRCGALRRFIGECRSLGEIWFARRAEIASHWHARFGNTQGSSRSDPQAVGS